MSRRTTRGGQLALGLLWLIDGGLQFQPYMFGRSFVTGVLLPSAAGQPRFVGAPLAWIAHQIEPRVALFNAFAATIEVLIGVGLLHRRTVKPALVASFVWALGIWVAGEGLGMLLTGTASPWTGAPGAALLYVLAGLMCWPRARQAVVAPRLAFGVLWLGYGLLWLLPGGSSGRGAAIAVSMAITCGAIGLAVARGWHTRTFLGLAIAVSLSYWVFGQGLGGVFSGEATDVGTAPLVILIAAMLMPGARRSPGRAGSPLRLQLSWPRTARSLRANASG
jgi:hypothetical protein